MVAFSQGMRARAVPARGRQRARHLVSPYGSPGLLALPSFAADDPAALQELAAEHRQLLTAHGVELLRKEAVTRWLGPPDTSALGFRDGMSQPGLRGITAVSDPARPDQGQPGQDLVWPGEFVRWPADAGPDSGPDVLRRFVTERVGDGPEDVPRT